MEKSDGVSLRHDWRPGDRALVMDLHRRGYLDYDDRFGALQIADLATLVGGMIDEAGVGTDPDHRVWFAEKAGNTIGCVALIQRSPTLGQLRWLILLPEARGHGLGRRLVEAVLERARALGLEQVFLLTTDGLAESMALYERIGFRHSETEMQGLWHGEGHEIRMDIFL